MAAAADCKMKISTTIPQAQKVQNRQKLEGEYSNLNDREFTKVGDIYKYNQVESQFKTFKSDNPIIVIIEAKFSPNYLYMAGNTYKKMKEIVYLNPPFDSDVNRRIIATYKRKLTNEFLEITIYLAYKTYILEKYDISLAR